MTEHPLLLFLDVEAGGLPTVSGKTLSFHFPILSLDAVLCLLQAAWAERAHAAGDPLYGLPPTLDLLEGWIATA